MVVAQSLTPDGYPQLSAETDDGIKFVVYFYRCDGVNFERCRLLQFRASFECDSRFAGFDINGFNRQWVYGKAYRWQNGNISVEHPIRVTGGVTRDNLIEHVALWQSIVSDWTVHVGWDEAQLAAPGGSGSCNDAIKM